MTKPDLLATIRHLRTLEKAATAGPWLKHDGTVNTAMRDMSVGTRSNSEAVVLSAQRKSLFMGESLAFCEVISSGCSSENAELVVAIRELLPVLLSELERRLVSEIECEAEYGAKFEKLNAISTDHEPVRGED